MAARRVNSSARSGSHAKGSGRPSDSPPGGGATVATPLGVSSPNRPMAIMPATAASTATATTARRARGDAVRFDRIPPRLADPNRVPA